MAGRFPGARDVETFWENIKAGRECVTRFPKEELEIPIEGLGEDGDYVCAKGQLDDIDLFDARFFGYLPREADVMDPQHRVFLEMCWEALEHAGCDAARYPGAIGVWGGCYMDTYVLWNLCSDDAFRARLVESIQVGSLQTELGNDKDYLATRVAFKLGLRGPAMTVQTACSTSLVAIVQACQSLESYACDMALAGGVTIVLPQKKGYFYKEGGMLSPDGRCRTFDAKAAGTVFSNGAAVVVLKRLEDAMRVGDEIYAVIRGYASNNDGGEKVSYTAPSVDGQAEVISLALKMGAIDARTIGYIEAHGTATPLGDPIEIAGLARAFREDTDDRQFCALGSLKANLGHLDVASGAIGLIKTSLALYEKKLPPQINFDKPNPKIDFAASPFFVNTELKNWPPAQWPRRAGVSSFGVGGTNAHVVVEEPPARQAAARARAPQLLVISARTEGALAAQAERLAAHLEKNRAIDLADAAWTLQTGRREFEHRRAVAASDCSEAIVALRKPGEAQRVSASLPEIVFVFPGQGAQYPGMGRRLYENEPIFRNTVDDVAEALLACEFGRDIRHVLLWTEERSARAEIAAQVAQTAIAQPAIFAVEVALARLLESWGLRPAAMIGHSVGEFAAAALAGVFSLADAARLVAARGALMQAMPPGRMLAVRAPRDAVEPQLRGGLCVAAVNSPGVTVVSGPSQDIDAFKTALERDGVAASILVTSHAFHSAMMRPAVEPFVARVAAAARSAPATAIISTATGAMAGAFVDPDYWGRQIVSPVLFAAAIAAAGGPNRIFLEVGPGQALAGMIRQTLTGSAARPAISCFGAVQDPGPEDQRLVAAVGRLWTHGASPDWARFQGDRRRRVALPTYPFERKRHWVEPKSAATTAPDRLSSATPASAPATADGVEALVQRQLQVVEAQLRVLRGR
jgi:acyl transferase domain-containing protein